jgi:hypothetical protein
VKRLALLLALLSFPLSCASGPKHPYQTEAQLRRYKVWRGTEDPFVIRATRIAVKDGCVLFYLDTTVDTILCDMLDVRVTELFGRGEE